MRNQNRSWKSLSVPHGWTTELINTPQRKKTTHASPKKLTYLACIASARQKPPPSFHARSQPAMRFFPTLTSTGPIIMTTSGRWYSRDSTNSSSVRTPCRHTMQLIQHQQPTHQEPCARSATLNNLNHWHSQPLYRGSSTYTEQFYVQNHYLR